MENRCLLVWSCLCGAWATWKGDAGCFISLDQWTWGMTAWARPLDLAGFPQGQGEWEKQGAVRSGSNTPWYEITRLIASIHVLMLNGACDKPFQPRFARSLGPKPGLATESAKWAQRFPFSFDENGKTRRPLTHEPHRVASLLQSYSLNSHVFWFRRRLSEIGRGAKEHCAYLCRTPGSYESTQKLTVLAPLASLASLLWLVSVSRLCQQSDRVRHRSTGPSEGQMREMAQAGALILGVTDRLWLQAPLHSNR
jgi:hypothetical protein